MMKMYLVGALTALLMSPTDAADPALPIDVRRYVQAAETCQHLAGEWDSELEKSEQKIIERNIRKYCGAAKRQLKSIQAKYKENEKIATLLKEKQYEAVTDYIGP